MENKEEIIRKVIFDLPHYSVRESMSDDEWYGWFEEVYDKTTTSQKETIERLREHNEILRTGIDNLYDAADRAISHVAIANYASREQWAKDLINTAYNQAYQLLNTTGQ